MFTLLFQSLAIAAIPYGEGAPLLSAIYGGGQLSIFLGWICRTTKPDSFGALTDAASDPHPQRVHCIVTWGACLKISNFGRSFILGIPSGTEVQDRRCLHHWMGLAYWQLDDHA